MTLATWLTLFRLLAAPAVALAYLALPRPWADGLALVLFIGASVTDWVDGHLARRWGQVTRLGTMLDPIADKAMVAAALLVLVTMSSLGPLILLPSVVILFREIFVSGLREFLGDVAGTLKVTALAKGKTTVQMVAIAVLFAHGLFEHRLGLAAGAIGPDEVETVLHVCKGRHAVICWDATLMGWSGWGGLVLLWLAAVLTLVTGLDYLRKAMPHLREPQ